MSTFKGLFITKNQEWVNELHSLLHDVNIEITVVSEWKRSFQEQQLNHYIFVDLEYVRDTQPFQNSSSVVIGLTESNDFVQGRSWLVSGAKDVVIFPEEKNRLRDLIKNTYQQLKFQKETETGFGTGQVHAFYSAKGGSGKTLLAALSAQSLSIHHEKKVLLVDLNAQFGNIEVLFGSQPFRSYYDLIPVMEEMDIRHLQNIAHYHEDTKVTLITGPADPAKAESIPDELISRLIRIARNQYDYILLDLPSNINNLTFTGLNESTHIHYVLTPDSLGMRAYKYADDLFKRFQIGRGNELSILINRHHSKSELTKNDIEKIIDRETTGLIPSDYFSIQPSLNMGEAFYKRKKDKGSNKVSKEVKKYVDELTKRTKG
ncbi:AAA family ATPase [Bacillus sp. 31A1R]|uniref:AAA family ATPase n=1 Tax=Robertmurraya mangrovi TaxID=3098077 RepID=A0ABU5J4T5_9BACI|nr:AAA family ATPase [Bacillus sp. 31A1R]MDZ5474429.1 AAA family ATPase [Bacillus sp. 31A1R]